MKVRELIEALKNLDPETQVVMAQDPEGNGYYKLSDLDEGTVSPDELSQYFIDTYYSNQHTDEQCCLEPGEREGFPKVICLWP